MDLDESRVEPGEWGKLEYKLKGTEVCDAFSSYLFQTFYVSYNNPDPNILKSETGKLTCSENSELTISIGLAKD